MDLYARQGDIVIEKLQTPITGELVKVKEIVFAGDSTGHPHVLVGQVEVRAEGRTRFVRVKTKRTIEHRRAGGHAAVKLIPGDYSIRPLREDGNGTDRVVED